MRTHILLALLATVAYSQNTCDKVDGGAGTRQKRKTSFACKCSGSGGCDSFHPKSYSSKKYAEWVVTDRASNRFAQQETLSWSRTVRPTNNETVLGLITGRVRQQAFNGFGTGLSDSAAVNINSLTSEAQQLLLSENFDGAKGNNMKYVRTNIGACAHSTRPYSYDESAGDVGLDNFALATEDVDLKMPIMSAVQAIKPDVEMVGSLFSGPSWMKTTDLEDSGSILHRDNTYYNALTNYLIKYVDAWTAKGFNFWGLSPLNEPIWGLTPDVGYPTTAWMPEYFSRWLVDSLAPTFMEKYPGLQLISNENSRLNTPFYVLVESDYINQFDPNTTLDNIWYYGIHWYHNEIPNFWIRVNELATQFHPMSTEAMFRLAPTESASLFLGSWDVAEEYAFTIIEDIQGNTTSWFDWNMVLDAKGGPSWVGDYATSAMQIDAADNDVFYKNPIFYILGHFSRFIEPGWNIVRSKTDHGPGYSGVSMLVAEGGDNDKVAVIQNRNGYDLAVNYFDVDLRQEVQFTLNADSITTLYYTTE